MFFTHLFTLATVISCLNLSIDARTIHVRDVGESNVPTGPTTLEPMVIEHVHHKLNRRSELPDNDDYSRLVPSEQELMMYGTPLGDGTYFVANFTLHAPPNTRILLMEKFEGLTRRVDCSTVGDNKLSISLIDEDVFEYIKIWSWINERDDNQFLMITNHEGCGPRSQRAVFWVSEVDYVEEALRVDFYAVQTEWAEVAGTYSIDYGSMEMEKKDRYEALREREALREHEVLREREALEKRETLEKRKALERRQALEKREPLEKRNPSFLGGLFNKVKNVGKKVVNTVGGGIKKAVDKVGGGIKKAADKVSGGVKKVVNGAKKVVGKVKTAVGKVANGKYGKDNINLSLAIGKKGAKKNIYTDIKNPQNPQQIVDCLDCYVTGKIIMAGHIQFQNFIPKSATFEAKPQNLATMMKFRVLIKAGGADVTFERDVYTVTLPGFSIPNIFTLGPKAELTVGFKSRVRTDADFTFGLKGSVPNSAVFRKDLLNKNAPGSSPKWNGVSVQPLPFEIIGGAIEMNFEASTNLVVGVGISVVNFVNYEAGFKLKLPRIGVDLKTITNKNKSPACPGAANKSPTGVSVTSDVNIELVAIAGRDTMTVGGFTEKQLWAMKFPLPKKCFPVKDSRGGPAIALAKPNKVGTLISKTKGLVSQVQAAKALIPSKGKKTTAKPKSKPPVKKATTTVKGKKKSVRKRSLTKQPLRAQRIS